MVFIPGVYVGCSTPNSESFARSISGLAGMLPLESQGLLLWSNKRYCSVRVVQENAGEELEKMMVMMMLKSRAS
jgi:hypothetical protein